MRHATKPFAILAALAALVPGVAAAPARNAGTLAAKFRQTPGVIPVGITFPNFPLKRGARAKAKPQKVTVRVEVTPPSSSYPSSAHLLLNYWYAERDIATGEITLDPREKKSHTPGKIRKEKDSSGVTHYYAEDKDVAFGSDHNEHYLVVVASGISRTSPYEIYNVTRVIQVW